MGVDEEVLVGSVMGTVAGWAALGPGVVGMAEMDSEDSPHQVALAGRVELAALAVAEQIGGSQL